jgi:predicted permease
MRPFGGVWPVKVPGSDPAAQSRLAMLRYVTPGYFAAMGIPLRSGRDVDPTDSREAPFTAVVSEAFARLYWPGQSPIGRHFQFAFFDRMVVGVVGDVRARGPERESEPQVYLPYRQVPDGDLISYIPQDLVVQTGTSPAAVLPALRRIIAAVDPEQPVSDVRMLGDIVESETAPRAIQVRVLAAFAGIAFLLAATGIHGLLSFTVSMRAQEIGVRIALGAQREAIFAMILRDAARLAALGIATGSIAAALSASAMRALLAGLNPSDVPTFGAAIALCLVMTLVGSLMPAIRAVRVDPATAIRVD